MSAVGRHSRGVALAFLGALGCAAPQPKADPGASAPSVERAVVAGADGVWVVPLDGAPKVQLSQDVASLCAVDPRSGVVWWVSFDPKTETSTLKARALGEDARVIAQGLPDLDALLLDFGPGEGALGRREGVTFQVGARLDLAAAPPKLEAWIGCEGDAALYCYDEVADKPPEAWPLKPDLAQRVESVKGAVLGERAFLERAAAQAGPLWEPSPPNPTLPRLSIPSDACESAEDCGEVSQLLGTRFVVVTVASSRGDFFHATRQAYDPASREFFDWREPSRRAALPLEGGGLGAYFVPPSGSGILAQGRVVSWERGLVYEADGALSCGWLEGGWGDGGFPFE